MKKGKNKSLLIVSLIFAFMLIGFRVPKAYAAEIIDQGTVNSTISWELDSSYVLTLSGSGIIKDLSSSSGAPWSSHSEKIQRIIVKEGITHIGKYVFSGCSNLGSVSLPSGLDGIGASAFQGCSSINSITIPESVTIIGESAFKSCTRLKTISIPKEVTKIDIETFKYCQSLTSVELPPSLKQIGRGAFDGCRSLTTVDLPDSVTSIGAEAFYQSSLSQIEIPNGVPTLQDSVFGSCTRLKEVTLSSGLTKIGTNAFYGCNSLKSLELPDGIISIGSSAFYGSGLTSIDIPDSVTAIDSFAFRACSGLTKVKLSNNLSQLSGSLFLNCTVLETITIPKSVNKIAANAFNGCTALNNISFEGNAPEVDSSAFSTFHGTINYPENDATWTNEVKQSYPDDVTWVAVAPTIVDSGSCGTNITWELNKEGVLTVSGSGVMEDYDNTNRAPWFKNSEVITSIVIEEGLTEIGNYAFYECQQVNSIKVASTVNTIGTKSFSGCRSLKELVCTKITRIGDYAFESCSNLNSVDLGYDNNGWLTLGTYVFKDCKSLKTIRFTTNKILPSIDYTSFIGCTSLQGVSFAKINYGGPYLSDGSDGSELREWHESFSGTVAYEKCALIKCFQGSSRTGVGTRDWLPEIGPYACYDCDNIETATIHDDTKVIGNSAFQDCNNLHSIELGKRLESIGELAFAECNSLKTVTISGSVYTIGANAFRGCSALESVYFRGDVPEIGDGIFDSDISLTVYYPDNNSTWTAEARARFGKNITWVSYSPQLTSLSNEEFGANIKTDTFIYDGNEKTLSVDWVKERLNSGSFRDYPLTPNVNYTVSYEDNIKSGTARLVVNGHGEYSGKIVHEFAIQPLVQNGSATVKYDGKRHSIDISALGDATIYFNETTPLTFDNYSNVGSKDKTSRTSAGTTRAYYIAVPNNNPTEASCVSGEAQLTIEKAPQTLDVDVSSKEIHVGDTSQITALSSAGKIRYISGNPAIATVDEEGVVTALSEGTVSITITAESTSNYKEETTEVQIKIGAVAEKSLSECDIADIPDYTYSGEAIEPELVIKDSDYVLKKDQDYSVKYSNNTNAGTARITISGKGTYVGSIIKSFTIKKASQSIVLNVSSNSIKVGSTTKITLSEETPGTVAYASEDNSVATVSKEGLVTGIAKGSVTITATAAETDNYLEAVKTLSIDVTDAENKKKNISSCEISLSRDSYTYDGKEKKPSVSVKEDGRELVENGEYGLSYPDNMTDSGTLEITVSGLEPYEGTKVLTYEILPADPTLSFADSSISKKTYDGSFTNVLKAVTDGVITYSSSDESVARVNAESGQVKIIGKGTATITATALRGRNYKGGTASYLLTVTEDEKKKISIDDLSYSFENSPDYWNYGKGNIRYSVVQKMFNNTQKADELYKALFKGKEWKGNCAGFSGTAALLLDPLSGISVKHFNPSARSISDLRLYDDRYYSDSFNMDVQNFIESMQVGQFTQMFQRKLMLNRIQTKDDIYTGKANLNRFYQEIKKETDAGRPVLLALIQKPGCGHAVLAYATEDENVSEDEAWILLYDSNHARDERKLILKKDANGDYTEWEYEHGLGYGVWGTDEPESSISYVPYETIKQIWNSRGNLKEDEDIFRSSSQSLAIYDENDTLVAQVADGKLTYTKDKDIYVLENLWKDKDKEDDLMLSMPVKTYMFDNLDKKQSEFVVSMTNNYLGISVSTTAKEITLAVNDESMLNAAYINMEKGDTYNVTLNASQGTTYKSVVVSGTGKGETAEISQSKGEFNFSNCNINSLVRDGEEVAPGQIGTKPNQITARNITLTSPSGNKMINLNPTVMGGAKLSYMSNNKLIKVSSNGIVTIPKNYVGGANITITAAPTSEYTSATKTIKVVVNPTGTALKKVKKKGSGKIAVEWKKNTKATGYQICYSMSASFKGAKVQTIRKNKIVKSTLKGKKKKTYYIRIRTYKTVAGKTYYSGWSRGKKVKVR